MAASRKDCASARPPTSSDFLRSGAARSARRLTYLLPRPLKTGRNLLVRCAPDECQQDSRLPAASIMVRASGRRHSTAAIVRQSSRAAQRLWTRSRKLILSICSRWPHLHGARELASERDLRAARRNRAATIPSESRCRRASGACRRPRRAPLIMQRASDSAGRPDASGRRVPPPLEVHSATFFAHRQSERRTQIAPVARLICLSLDLLVCCSFARLGRK